MPQLQKETHKTIYLKDYRPPDYLIRTVNLEFELDDIRTRVRSTLTVTGIYDRSEGIPPLVLNGEKLVLKSARIDGQLLTEHDYKLTSDALTLLPVPEEFTLEIETEINPSSNTELTGLYLSGGSFFTQCEAEGFRKITYYPDRPDVMARFFTTITADRKKYPVLLSNGNLIGSGALGDGLHFAKWHDPFPKPAYLFALVAGDFARITDRFTTLSGKNVDLHIYVQHHNKDKCDHAMKSLKLAMEWDEKAYGREYDLDVFMIVATDDFNMGAMENKGLNIFNSKYVLAKPETATDADFQGIMGVVAHEYFHNWSGDRVTCRDWFQLSLKEGFTVYRDQQFMEEMTSHGVKRISEVNLLRTHQFREDSGPMAHPVRPDSYVEINNFYTMTVYNKGAEVIRMLRTVLGTEGFRKGCDLYFSRHDHSAVTTDDFVTAMEDANGFDLSQFRLWYSQAGTPELDIHRAYDAKAKTWTLAINQKTPPTPGQESKKPMHIPLAVGLLGKDGNELPLNIEGASGSGVTGARILHVRNERETFVFTGVPDEPVPSLLRDFSAPVKLNIDLTDQERLFLMANDSDDYNRWDAGQQLAVKYMLDLVNDHQRSKELALSRSFTTAFARILESTLKDKAFQALALTLPAESYVADFLKEIDPGAIHEVRRFMQRTLAKSLKQSFLEVYHTNEDRGPYQFSREAVGRRSLRNTCLSYLMVLDEPGIRKICLEQFLKAGNMTDSLASLSALADTDCEERHQALASFYEKWKSDQLVMDKWLSIQATSSLPDTLKTVMRLTMHPVFSLKNPNKVRALIGAFAQGNPARFHDPSGEGYAFVADIVLSLDRINPQIAARLVSAFTLWKRYNGTLSGLMKFQLERILASPRLSRDVHEIVSKSLC